MKTAYGYSRYSSASQSDGSTIQTQQDAIENYCIDHGIKLLNHYADLAISGKDAEHRREFLKMIHDAVVTKVDYIIVYTRDRFSRSVKDFVKYLQILADNDTSLICVSENGEVFSDVQYDSYSKEAYELYFDLWGEDEMYVYNEKLGNYVYVEDEG